MTLHLRDYQQVAKGFLQHNPRSALFLDMGLGKTAVVLSALSKENFPVLVVAPKKVAETVWPVERDLWRPDLSIQLAAGTPQERARAFHTPSDITVVAREHVGEAERFRWRTVVIDELSAYKNRGGARWKILNRMVNGAKSRVTHVWGLTGTPAPNGQMDLWAQVYLLDHGKRLGKTLTEFRTRYFWARNRLPNGIVTKWEIKDGMEEKINSLLSDICLSMTTEGRIHLPKVHHNEIRLTMTERESEIYRKLDKTMVADLTMLGGEIHTAKNAAALTTKLSQFTAGFLYSDDRGLLDEAKTTALNKRKIEALKQVIEETPTPVLVFYRFDEEKDRILKAIPEARSINEKGIIPEWCRGEVPVLLAHPASASHGLNLQHGGHTIVWTTLDWSLEFWQQANKRLHRSGQKHPVIIHRIMAYTSDGKPTVDHKILRVLGGKTTVQDALIDHLESPI